MPKDIVGVIAIVVVAFFMVQTGLTYAMGDSRQKDIVSTLTESIESSAVESFDYSSRVDRGLSYIDTTVFEENFEKHFNEDGNVNMDNYSLEYDYLKDGESVKAIRVTLTDDKSVEYKATVAVDISND